MMIEIIKQELKNLKSPLYRNSIYISMTSLVTAIAGFLFWSVAARLYPSSQVGVASAVVSAINLTFTLSMLGLNFALIRFYPQYRERAIGSSLVLAITASFAFSLIYGLIMKNSESFSGVFSAEFLAMFVGFSVVGTAYTIISTYAIAKRKAEHSFVQAVLFALRFAFLFLFVSLGVFGIVGSFGLGLLLGVVYGIIFIDDLKLGIDKEYIRDSFRFSLGNYIASIANVAPNYLMPTIVLTMLGKEEAAYFYIAFAIGTLILFVPNAINTSFFVEGSHGLKDVKRTLKKALVFSYLYLTLVTVFVWLFGEYVLGLFRPEYVNGFGLLKLMVIGGFFVVPVNFSITILNIQKRVREVLVINVLKAVLFLGLSYLLIPRFGIEGVGWGWIGAYTGLLIFIIPSL
ncbi:lipopolysaccharide biosynthesis protein [Thermococcus sp. MAR1]|uniref:lipopolysaccharide biosynthesis protein n=1 Tax=Thermococcus sp. MAR1 TaxID=1638263 RepID=UPI001F0DFFF8|nr:polysaccharide biosynthesis C-terminal domain-containing protein [Thermococcus sp. MAR1]